MTNDRLSGLMERFNLTVDLDLSVEKLPEARLMVVGDKVTREPTRVILSLVKSISSSLQENEVVLIFGDADWGGQGNPFVASLDKVLEFDLATHGELMLLVELLVIEHDAKRCGSASVLNRIAEILIVLVLRTQIEKGSAEIGLIAGLAEPRLSKALVAIHDNPSNAWDNRELASISGVSLSRFCYIFASKVGSTPMAYLRSYRLTLACEEIKKGNRLKSVAAKYGYGSGEALSRAMKKEFGQSPRHFLHSASV